MKKIYLFAIMTLLVMSCGKTSSTDQVEETASSPEDELYQKAMAVHDEVMPKMNDIYKLKKQLEEEIKNSPDMVVEKKQTIEIRIKQLNTASESMMQWMRDFDPEGHKADKKEYIEYLKSEIEKVNKVKEDMLTALEEKDNNK